MGLLRIGHPMTWDEAQKYKEYVKKHGSLQFLANFRRNRDRVDTCFRWGDEVEYYIVDFDAKARRATLSLRAPEIIEQTNRFCVDEGEDTSNEHEPHVPLSSWYPEFGRFMIEGTPGQPYSNRIIHYWAVEENMVLRRHMVGQALKPSERLMTLCAFPTMGVGYFTTPPHSVSVNDNVTSRSIFVPDDVISPHLRFSTLARNIRHRRDKKVAINIPVFMDKNTDLDVIDTLNKGNHIASSSKLDDETPSPAQRGHVYMDTMAFGMGSCCLQCTFQACSIKQARHLYDQLTPLAPIMMALSAATPIYRGVLVDCDVRWPVIEASVDDRTDAEIEAGISKSRYGTTSMYISEGDLGPLNNPCLNDCPIPVNESVEKRLLDGGVDSLLAKHVAHLFVRDPIVIFDDVIDAVNKDTDNDEISDMDESSVEHFENVQSTNWNPVRFKPPPADGSCGWRVEFRTMELGITDFVNAAHAVFVALLVRLIVHSKCNFYMPMSKVEYNSRVAWSRDALHKEKFYFPRCVCPSLESKCENKCDEKCGEDLFTIDEIINGTPNGFAGLVPLVRQILDGEEDLHKISKFERPVIDAYLNLISDRASGKLVNVATWMRQFVMNHKDYNHDSIVSDATVYDLLKTVDDISMGKKDAPELFGTYPHARDKNVNELHRHLFTFGDDEDHDHHESLHSHPLYARVRRATRLASEG